MGVGGGVLALLFPVTSDPSGVVCCACLAWSPRGGVQVVGLRWSSVQCSLSWRAAGGGVCSIRCVQRRVCLVCLSAGLARVVGGALWGPCRDSGCVLCSGVPLFSGGSRPGWCLWGFSGDGAVGEADGEGVGGDAPGYGAARDADGECRCSFVVSLVVPVVTALPVM